jgi:hypothetical protein
MGTVVRLDGGPLDGEELEVDDDQHFLEFDTEITHPKLGKKIKAAVYVRDDKDSKVFKQGGWKLRKEKK